ncbi:MAG: nitroreductase [Myxococcota bacterium]
MDAHDALRSRRTIHFYTDAPVDEAIVQRALECALRAPNHKLTNPWRFTLVGTETRAQITEVGLQIKRDKGASEDKLQRSRVKLSTPPVLLVVSQVRDDDAFRNREDYAATACAIQNLMVSLWSDGVGSKWSTGGITRAPQTYALTNIDPAAEEIVGFVWAGYPEQTPDPPRAPLQDMLRHVP